MSLKSVLTATIAVATALMWQTAAAQASAPMTRDQVKAETAAANKAGQLTPAGGGTAPVSKSTAKGPTKTRDQRKAETMQARKEGTLAPAGETQHADKADAQKASTKTREQRKAETMEARKKGELRPAGQ